MYVYITQTYHPHMYTCTFVDVTTLRHIHAQSHIITNTPYYTQIQTYTDIHRHTQTYTPHYIVYIMLLHTYVHTHVLYIYLTSLR